MDDTARFARNAGWILLLGGLLKLLVAFGYVGYVFRAAPSDVRGFSVASAMLLAVPIAGYGAYDLGAGIAVRRGMVIGRVLGFLSGAFGALAFCGLGLTGLSALISYAIGSGPAGALIGAAMLASIALGAVVNVYLLSALWKGGDALKG